MEKDEEKMLSRKRLEKWMKILLVFLAFAWLCTIISKSIYVSGLTRVRTDTASKKYVEHIVETDGIVTTGGEIAVNTQSGLRVDRIYVRQGDAVKEGDVLFTIDCTDLTELIKAKETELARQQYNLSDLQTNAVIDAQKKEIALLWAQEDYDTADKETAIEKKRAEEAIARAEAALAKHLADPVPYTSDSARRDEWKTYNNWVNRGYDISDKITAKEREIQDLEEELAELERYSNETGAGGSGIDGKVLSGAAGGQEDIQTESDGDNDTANSTDSSDSGENTCVETNPDTGTNVGENSTENENNETEIETETDNTITNDNMADNADSTDNKSDETVSSDDANDKGDTNSNDTEDKNNEKPDDEPDDKIDEKPDDKTDTNPDNTNYTDVDNKTDTAPDNNDIINTDTNNNSSQNPETNAKKLELQNKIKQARQEATALQDELTKHDRAVVKQPDYSEEELEYDAWQNTKLTLEANVQSAREHYYDVSYAREVTLRQKLRDIANAQVTAMADSTAAVYELDINQTKTQLAKLYAVQKQKGEIRAQSDGVISAIQVAVGGRTADTAAVLMTDGQRPCQFKFSITKEQGKYIHLNDTVELKLNGQSTAMEIKVDYFAENAQGGYDAICMLPEGVGQPGLSGSIQKTVQGEYHNLTLPVDAVFGEMGAYYIYTLNEKEGILGSEYYVEKIKVQLKDQNDRYAALESGTISADTKVIVYSTKELKQGESVRPSDA